jgi:hypothetical protein
MTNARTPRFPRLAAALAVAACASPAWASAAPAADDEVARHYGFRPLEVLKVDPDAGPFTVADMDGDGLDDIVVADDFKNRIDINFQRKGASPTDERPAKGVNEFPEHWRYRRESITVDRAVAAIVPVDWDRDGRMDLVYAGNNPPGIVFVRQSEPGTFRVARKQTVRNLAASRDGLAVADVLGGAAPELVSVVDGKVSVWPLEGDTLGAPTELSAGGARVVAAILEDFDGNGTTDILGVIPEDAAPVRAWFTERQGDRLFIGPQVRFEMPPVREVVPVRLPGRKAALIGTVERPTKRVAFHRVGRGAIEGAGSRDSSLVTWSFEDPQNRKRRTVVADVDADGLADVVATNTLANALMTYRQEKAKGLGAPMASPSFADLDSVAVAPTAQGAIVFSLSEKEGVVGRSLAGKDGAIGFPQAVQLGAGRTPVAINLVDLDGERHLAVVAKDGKSFVVELVPVDGPADPAHRVTVNLGTQSRSPNAVAAVDADQDGFSDLLVFTPEKPMIMLRSEGKVPADAPAPAGDAAAGGDGAKAPAPAAAAFKVMESKDMGQFGLVQSATGDNTLVADVDGNGKGELLVADRNYVRALRYEPKPAAGASPGWQVVAQMNARNPDAKLVTLARLGDRVVAGDRDGARAIVFARDAGGRWDQSEVIEIPGFKFGQLVAGRFAGDGNDGLLAVGDDSFALVRLAGERIVLEPVGTWSSDDPRQVPHELVVGDLNGDGYVDAVVLDGGEQMANVLTFSKAERLVPALSFKVFESRLFTGGDRQEFEPSSGAVADVTGDGLDDLVFLAHDRLLIYPQAGGSGDGAAAPRPGG